MSATGSSRPLVLIVEDEPMLMLGAVQMFEAQGFESLVAFSTDEAIGHLEESAGIAVVFIEYDAPGTIDGPAFARTVRGRWPTVEMIMVSKPRPHAMEELPLGTRYFEKPFSHREVERALGELGMIASLPRARVSVRPRA